MQSPQPESGFPGRALRIAGRAALLRCPNCGGRGILRSWFRLAARCPSCGLALERHEQGYRVGAYMFNIAMAELVFVVVFVTVLVLTWPDPPWAWLTFASATLVITLPVAFYPFSQTLFLGFDLLFHPPDEQELRRPRDPSP
jgi:uncharacterized protein (DUF983 family)